MKFKLTIILLIVVGLLTVSFADTLNDRKIDDKELEDSIILTTNNPLKAVKLLNQELPSRFSLLNIIPVNRNYQELSQICWAFTTLDTIATSLSLKDYYNGNKENPKSYDFSEIFMDYASTRTVADKGKFNPYGVNKKAGIGANVFIAMDYLTSGAGIVKEKEMPFCTVKPGEVEGMENTFCTVSEEDPGWYDKIDNNQNIELINIQNKTNSAQVLDTIQFPYIKNASGSLGSTEFEELKNKIKSHVMNYGGIYASISMLTDGVDALNSNVHCKYDETYSNPENQISNTECNNRPNHSVTIIGWDDDHVFGDPINPKVNKPNSKGAWIVNNSMGTSPEHAVNLTEIRNSARKNFCETRSYLTYEDGNGQTKSCDCIANGWVDSNGKGDNSKVNNKCLDQRLRENWYITFDEINNLTYSSPRNEKYPESGIMYVSYEDMWIYTSLLGITNVIDGVNYDEMYQHNIVTNYYEEFDVSDTHKIYISDTFERNDTKKEEYLTSVSMVAGELNTVKVYIGTSIENALDEGNVRLKAGESETFEAGYHTLEFEDPIKISSENFTVVLEIQVPEEKETAIIRLEGKGDDSDQENYRHDWPGEIDSGKYNYINQDKLDGTGAYSTDSASWFSFSDYNLISKTGTVIGADTTIKAFTVSEIQDIEITNAPTYIEGDNFDKEGLVLKKVYRDGSKVQITDYGILDGNNLQVGKNTITITYDDKAFTKEIVVQANTLENLKIEGTAKSEYTEGDNFDKTGLKVIAVYKNGKEEEITNYEIKNGVNLNTNQTSVIVSYGGIEVEYVIRVVSKPKPQQPDQPKEEQPVEPEKPKEEIKVELKEVSIKKIPNKTTYIQNEEKLDLTGGILLVKYSDNKEVEVDMTSAEITVNGYDNTKLGEQELELIFKAKKVKLIVKIIKKEIIENSNIKKLEGKLQSIKSYNYTNEEKQDYVVMNVELTGIKQTEGNKNLEYYYYLTSIKEENIKKWIKIEKITNEKDKLKFEINSKDIENYNNLIKSDVLFLYVKEVAIKESNKSETISNAIQLNNKTTIQKYVDDKLEENKIIGETIENKEEIKEEEQKKEINYPMIIIIISVLSVLVVMALKKYKEINAE